jgi:hypothetical protein
MAATTLISRKGQKTIVDFCNLPLPLLILCPISPEPPGP